MTVALYEAAAPAGCRFLEFDSEFFGRRLARVEPAALTAARIDDVRDWWRRERIDGVYLLVDVDDQGTQDAASGQQFRLVDLRVTLEAPSASSAALPLADGARIRPAESADVEALKRIALQSHTQTRFYVDDHFDRARCDELYQLWIAKSCGGWADHVLVAEVGGRAVGYVTCHKRHDEGQIGLVGVDAASRGRGAGLGMMVEARRWFAEQGLDRVIVATQGRNAKALRLYQKADFSVTALQLWYHKWL